MQIDVDCSASHAGNCVLVLYDRDILLKAGGEPDPKLKKILGFLL